MRTFCIVNFQTAGFGKQTLSSVGDIVIVIILCAAIDDNIRKGNIRILAIESNAGLICLTVVPLKAGKSRPVQINISG